MTVNFHPEADEEFGCEFGVPCAALSRVICDFGHVICDFGHVRRGNITI